MGQHAWPTNGIRFLEIAPPAPPPATPPATPPAPNRARRGPGLDLCGREEIRTCGWY